MSPRTLGSQQAARSRMGSRESRSRTPLPLNPGPGSKGGSSRGFSRGNGASPFVEGRGSRPASALPQGIGSEGPLDGADFIGEAAPGPSGGKNGQADDENEGPPSTERSKAKAEHVEAHEAAPRGSDTSVVRSMGHSRIPSPPMFRSSSVAPLGSGRPSEGGAGEGGAGLPGPPRSETGGILGSLPGADRPCDEILDSTLPDATPSQRSAMPQEGGGEVTQELSPLTLSLVDDLEGMDDVLMWVCITHASSFHQCAMCEMHRSAMRSVVFYAVHIIFHRCHVGFYVCVREVALALYLAL